jgi:hypothetical protein
MGWRDNYKVHPAADALPMMPDDELAELGEDIKQQFSEVTRLRENDGPGDVSYETLREFTKGSALEVKAHSYMLNKKRRAA